MIEVYISQLRCATWTKHLKQLPKTTKSPTVHDVAFFGPGTKQGSKIVLGTHQGSGIPLLLGL